MRSFLVVQLDESPVLVLFEKETGKAKTTIELTTTSDGESFGDSEDQNSDLSSNDRHTNEAAEERSAPDSEWEPKRGVHWCTGDEAVFTVDAYGARRYDNGDEDPSWCTGEEMFGDATKQSVCAYLDGMLFVATEDVVAVIRATDGTVRCSRELDVPETADLRLLIASERLYVSEGDRIIAIDVSTGAELWTHAPGDEHRSQTVQKFVDIVEGVVVTIERSDTQYVCGYDAETGTRRWAFQDRRSLTVEGVHDGTVYLDGGEVVVLALSVATGVLRWDHQFRKLAIPPDDYKRRARPDRSSINYLTLTDHGIVTSNWSGGIYLLDPATGEKEWEVYPEDPDAGPEAACRVVEDTIVRIKDTKIEGFDLDSGDQQWSFESGDLVPTDTQWGLPVASDDRLYCVDYEGVLYEIGSDGLTRIFRPDRETAHEFALDSERVYLAPHNMDTGIPAYRKAQMADGDSESDQDDSELLALKR
jgi:outer membrane protein assembly factor BamB